MAEDVAESYDPGALLMLAVFELRQQVILVCLLDLLELAKYILEELFLSLRRDD